MQNKHLFINGFWIKIIAMVAMTLDHIGFMLGIYYYNQSDATNVIITIFRGIGQIALPLFCFLILQGVLHTKSIKNYLIRLSIMLVAIMVAIILSESIPYFKNAGFSIASMGNIFIDLLLGALTIYLLNHKNKYFKLIAVFPLIFGILSFFATYLEQADPNTTIWWFPYFLRTQSGFFAILLCAGFYGAYYFYNLWLNSTNQANVALYQETPQGRFILNLVYVFVLVVIISIYFVITRFVLSTTAFVDPTFGIFSGALILFYNGKRGYNKSWFKYGCYLYYPLHILILFIVFTIISTL